MSDVHLIPHYRAGFRLGPLGSDGKATVAGVQKLVRSWIKVKVGTDAGLLGKWYFSGGRWTPGPNVVVRTATFEPPAGTEVRLAWALSFSHPDAVYRPRRWTTDLGISVNAEGCYVYLSVGHGMVAELVGDEPPLPASSCPMFVRGLLEARGPGAWAGSERLSMDPITITDRNVGDIFPSRLQDPTRLCPMIVVTCDPYSERTVPRNIRTLAQQLAGTSNVYVFENKHVQRRLEGLLPREFSCWDGAVRVYLPGVRLDDVRDARRHRYILADEIQGRGDAWLAGALVRWLVQRERVRFPGSARSIQDVEELIRQSRIRSLEGRAARSADDEELLNLLYQERDELKRRTDDLGPRVFELEEANEILEDEVALLRSDKDRLHAARKELQTALNHTIKENDQLRGEASLLSLSDAIDRAKRRFPDRLWFTQESLAGAQKSPYRSPEDLWLALRGLAEVLYAECFVNGIPLRQAAVHFQDQVGVELSIDEAESVKNDKRLRRQRNAIFEGKSYECFKHLSIGDARQPDRCLRIHFELVPERRKIVVGHIGRHLDTTRTN